MPRSVCIVFFLTISCRHYLEVDPPKNSLTQEHISLGFQTASAVLDGIYGRMISGTSGFASGGLRSVTLLTGLSADELVAFSGSYLPFQANQLDPSNSFVTSYLWAEPYQYIYTANSLLRSVQQPGQLTNTEINLLSGEAKFVRAFCYFYLTSLFGDVPLHLTDDYKQNKQANRTTRQLVYEQVITDLIDARQLLKTTNSLPKRTRPSYWAATALLARTYLYTRQYELAEETATEIISQSSLFELEADLAKVFLANSREAIWQLKPVIPNINTHEGNIFILTGRPSNVALSVQVRQVFEPNDLRGQMWIGSTSIGQDIYLFPFKYKVAQSVSLQEYSMVFRLAEQYLIRAEARVMRNALESASGDLNIIRKRAALTAQNFSSKQALLSAIFLERRKELFVEWGHRWFDVNRALNPDSIFAAKPGSVWQPTDRLYPIPISEMNLNPNISQNSGY